MTRPHRRWLRPAGLALLAVACTPIGPTPPDVDTRHFASTDSAGNGAYWHIFLFGPSQPRNLPTRIALARAAIAVDPDCAWVGADRDQIAARTAAQGARFADTTLAAPVRCRD